MSAYQKFRGEAAAPCVSLAERRLDATFSVREVGGERRRDLLDRLA